MNKKLIGFLIGCLIPSTTFGAAVIFSGADVKALKSNLDLNGQAKIMSGTVDPSVTATSANPGSLYLNTSSGKQYRKQDSGSSTNWVEVGSGSGSGSGLNFIVNGDFEAGVTNWTAVGLAFSIGTGSNALIDLKSGIANASAASQTLTSAGVAITSSSFKGLAGGNGYFACFTKTVATDYVLQVTDGTNILATRSIVATDVATEQGQVFPIPTSGSIYLQLLSASNAADITLDNCFMGSKSFAQVGSAEIYGGVQIQAGNFDTTSGSYTNLPGSGGANSIAFGKCTGGNDRVEMTCTLQPGMYEISLTGGSVANFGGASAGAGLFRISDGTNTSSNIQFFTSTTEDKYANASLSWVYPVTSTVTKTFKLQGYTPGSVGTARYSVNDPAQFYVKRFPIGTDQALKVDTIAWDWSGYLSGATWTTTASSPVSPTASGASTLTTLSAKGAVCTQVGNAPSFSCTIPVLGKVKACFSASLASDTAGTFGSMYAVIDGVELGTATAENSTSPGFVCAEGSPASTTFTAEVKLRRHGGAGSAELNFHSPYLSLKLQPMDQQVPAPLLVGSVVTGSPGVIKEIHASIDSSGTIVSQTGGIASVGHSATGIFPVAFDSGFFSGAPHCSGGSVDLDSCASLNGSFPTTSGFTMRVKGCSTATDTDSNFTIHCWGEK